MEVSPPAAVGDAVVHHRLTTHTARRYRSLALGHDEWTSPHGSASDAALTEAAPM